MTTNSHRAQVTLAVAAVAIVAAAAGYLVFVKPAMAGTVASPAAAVKSAMAFGKVAAVVNGQEIYDSELSSGIQQGVDRAVVIDRYINKALAADLAKAAYSRDATEVLKGAEREVLSQLFIAKKTEELRAGVTDVAVKSYYDTNIKVEDFTGYKVKYLVATDEKDAGDVAAAIAAGKSKDVEARFKAVRDSGDPFVLAPELPYGLGNVVRSLKKGEYSRPVVMRNGYFILFLEDTKPNPKPEFAMVAEEIKNVMVAKQLTELLAGARTSAKVELR
jgi:peptidyl-prolyl cis-trans isomerase C